MGLHIKIRHEDKGFLCHRVLLLYNLISFSLSFFVCPGGWSAGVPPSLITSKWSLPSIAFHFGVNRPPILRTQSSIKRTLLPGGSPVDFPESDTDVTIRDASGHYISRRKPVQDIHVIEVQGGG